MSAIKSQALLVLGKATTSFMESVFVKQHHDAVKSQCHSQMGRGSVLEGVEEKPKLFVGQVLH